MQREKLPMNQHPDVEPRPGAGKNANRRRCAENGGVECTVARLAAAPPSGTRTHSGMVIIPQRPSLAVVSYPS